MARLLVVCVGGFLGTGARYGLNGLVARRYGESFPWGTIVVNVIGSFLAGMLFFVTGPDSPILVSPTARQFLLAGLLGGFTTFSSFSLQTLTLLRSGESVAAAANAAGSVLVGLLAAWSGLVLARAIWMSR